MTRFLLAIIFTLASLAPARADLFDLRETLAAVDIYLASAMAPGFLG